MPIVIDTTSDNIDQQLKQAKDVLSTTKQVDAKYFSPKHMTGNGKRTAGLFSNNAKTITEFTKEKRRMLDGTISINQNKYRNIDKHQTHTFGNHFAKTTKPKDNDNFQQFEHNLTTIIPPVIFEGLSTNYNVALTFPKETGMYNLNALKDTWTKVTSGTIDGEPVTTYVLPVIQSMTLYSRERKTVSSKTGAPLKDNATVAQPDIYLLFATIHDDMNKDGDIIFTNHIKKPVNKQQGVVSIGHLSESTNVDFDWDDVAVILDDHIVGAIKGNNINIPNVAAYDLKLLIGDTDLYEQISKQAMLITHQSKEILQTFASVYTKHMTHIAKAVAKGNSNAHLYQDVMHNDGLKDGLISFIQHIDLLNEMEENLISTELLASIYQAIKSEITDPKELNNYARHSLRLLLSQRLHELDEIHQNNGLYEFNPTNQAVTDAMKANNNYSPAQKNIVLTKDPLVIGQAGAGSGKSHTLIGRINYLKDQGENLSNVLVLSFTNVAAINITQRFPGVRSETLANMFHTIYSDTYPGQSLSQPSTVANSLRLLNPKANYFQNMGLNADVVEQFINDLASRLEQFDQTGFKRVDLQQELKHLSNLIENNLQLTTIMLNAVEQTTLELEPIIIHHQLLLGGGGLNIPEAYQNLNYIITDESQDISTFEYILLLELTIHYRSQLLIIGDGSQTLYEFRNSDPRYMNALESSGVFVSHKLETNYRSKEEILMYANQFLQVIDANKFANIQLKSSMFTTPTPQSVNETINVSNNELLSTRTVDYNSSVQDYVHQDQDFQKWFLEKVRKGEQVAIMGWTRQEVLAFGESIGELLNANGLKNIELTNIMSNNERPMTILSRFSKEANNKIRNLDPLNANYLPEVDRLIDVYIKTKHVNASSKQAGFFHNLIYRNISDIVKSAPWHAWMQDYKAGRVGKQQIGGFLIQQLLKAETRKNAMDQFLRKKKEVPDYSKCPIILSTIHGTKGLEFDHTVVLFNENKKGATSQEAMRMYFVALSRAKQSEWIVNSHRPTHNRAISDTNAAMFQTPMETAFMRTLRDAKALQPNSQAVTASTAASDTTDTSSNSTGDVSDDTNKPSMILDEFHQIATPLPELPKKDDDSTK